MLFLDILECTQFFFHDLIWPIEDTPDNSAAQDDSNNQNAGNDNNDDDMINGTKMTLRIATTCQSPRKIEASGRMNKISSRNPLRYLCSQYSTDDWPTRTKASTKSPSGLNPNRMHLMKDRSSASGLSRNLMTILERLGLISSTCFQS